MAKAFEKSEVISIEEFSKLPWAILSTVGMPAVTENNVLKIKINFLFYASFFNLAGCVFLEIVYVGIIVADPNKFNFMELVYLILCIGFIFIAIAKMITLSYKRGILSKLVGEFYEYFPKTVEDQRTFRVSHYVRRVKLIMSSYTFVQLFMIWCFNLFPLSETIKGYLHDGSWHMDFSYILWYPIDPYKRGFFEVFYASQFWAAHVSASGILVADILLCCIVKQIVMHYTDLKRRLLLLKPLDKLALKENDLIKTYVEKHNKIIEWTRILDNVFAVTTLFNFASSSIVICVTGFSMIYSDSISENIKFSFTLITCIVQIYLVSWLGDRICESSTDIANGAYNSDWHQAGIQYQRKLLLIMIRSQRAEKLTAYKFFTASRTTFTSVLSTSWRFLTLLNTMYSGK